MKFLPITLKSTIFFYFVWKVHEATECIKPECEIACFIIPLKEVLFNLNKDDKTYQKKKKKKHSLLNVLSTCQFLVVW